MELITVQIEKPDAVNLILGQSHFIKTVEDLHEALVTSVPGIKFGLAFCESSGPALVRASGTDPALSSWPGKTHSRLERATVSSSFWEKGFILLMYSTRSRRCRKCATSSAPQPTRLK